MMKIITLCLLVTAFGAQAQQFERYYPTNPNWNPQCLHAKVMVYSLDKKHSHTTNFEFCPGREAIQEQMVCVLPDGTKDNLRCYHSAYGKDEYIIGKPVVLCMLRGVIQNTRMVTFYCTEPKSAEEWIKEMGK